MHSSTAPQPTADAALHTAGVPWRDTGTPERVAVFRALHFGDLLCAVPALRALRAGLPHARVTLIGLPWAREFAARFRRYVDDFIAFPGALGLPERAASADETQAFMREAVGRRFDLALQLHGSGIYSNAVVAAIGARRCAGFHGAEAANPDPACFVPYPEQEPEVRRLLRLVEFLGFPSQGEELEFPIERAEWRALAALRMRYGLRPGQYACVHPGARVPARRWSTQRFAHVADHLTARGLQVVLTGAGDEAPLTAAVARATHGGCIDLAGQAHGGLLAALLTGARVLVCNDTGVSHMAAALRAPSVVVFTGSSPQRWAPLDGERHRRVVHAVDCRPCSHWACPIGHPCAAGVSVDQVMQEVDALLN